MITESYIRQDEEEDARKVVDVLARSIKVDIDNAGEEERRKIFDEVFSIGLAAFIAVSEGQDSDYYDETPMSYSSKEQLQEHIDLLRKLWPLVPFLSPEDAVRNIQIRDVNLTAAQQRTYRALDFIRQSVAWWIDQEVIAA
jgi:hypothetical protein